MSRKATTPTTAREVYHGSNGGRTRSFCCRLEKSGQLGRIAAALFRSDGSIFSYRELAYEHKCVCLHKLCNLLETDNCGLEWGWRIDPGRSFACFVLYVDLPEGQVSFHSPDYDGDWDGEHRSEMRILDFADQISLEREFMKGGGK
jgi:hypothetical protein